MKKLLVPLVALLVASPAYAISIVSLHGGGMCIPFSSWEADPGTMFAGVLVLAAVITVLVLQRKKRKQ